MKKILFLLLFPVALFAQPTIMTDSTDIDTDAANQYQIENAMEDAGDENAAFDFDTQFENLADRAIRPFDINRVTGEELGDLQLLSNLQIEAFLTYRKRHGEILTMYELQGIDGWDNETIFRVLPYLTITGKPVERKTSIQDVLKYGKRQLFLRWQRVLETADGYRPIPEGSNKLHYLGSPDRFYARFRWQYKDKISFGLTAEKDPGEEFFKGTNKQGFDFYSAHLFLNDLHPIVKQIAIGDFSASMGQGLLMWSGFGIRKGQQTSNVKRFTQLIRPYTSVNEASFLRGVGLTLAPVKNLEVMVFGSSRKRDANLGVVDSLGQEESEAGVSIDGANTLVSGFHRTTSEVADKNTIRHTTIGSTVRYRGAHWAVGLNGTYNHLSNPFQPDPYLYYIYRFSGNKLFNFSADYALLWDKYQFFGETAISDNGGIATMNGFMAHLGERVNFTILHRHYQPKYQTLWGNAFAESTRVNNETGLYMGANIDLGRSFVLAVYFDMFRFPWVRNNLVAYPSRGHEYFAKLTYTPNRRISTYLQFKNETKEQNLSENVTPFNVLIPRQTTRVRLHIGYILTPEFEMRSRIELTQFKLGETYHGVMAYQDFIYAPKKLKLKIQARFALFDSNSFFAAPYAYENDVLYSFSVPAYYGRGMRWYINTKYDISKKLSIWVRYARTRFSDRDEISSGLNAIQGNTRSEVKVQLRYKF